MAASRKGSHPQSHRLRRQTMEHHNSMQNVTNLSFYPQMSEICKHSRSPPVVLFHVPKPLDPRVHGRVCEGFGPVHRASSAQYP